MAFVGGTRGGFIFPQFLFAIDGMYGVAKIMEMVAHADKSLAELDAMIPRRSIVSRAVDCPWEFKGRVMRRAMEHSEKTPRQLLDGVKIFLDDKWVLLIPDKERPLFHIIVETDSHEHSAGLAREYEMLVREWKEDRSRKVVEV